MGYGHDLEDSRYFKLGASQEFSMIFSIGENQKAKENMSSNKS